MWMQPYLLGHHGDLVSALLAALPILAVLLLLSVWRTPVWLAGLAGLLVSAFVALLLGHMPPVQVFGAATLGASFGVFPILWIILWALVLFRVTVETGRFEVMQRSIAQATPDRMAQALLIAFGFEAFLEGAAGFGTPVAIAASILVGLGLSPLQASAICLLANTSPVAFGSLGIPLVTLAATTGLPLHELGVWVAALCAPLAVILPMYTMASFGGRKDLRRLAVPALAVGVVFALVQWLVAATIGPALADIVASLAAIAVLVAYFTLSSHSSRRLSPVDTAQVENELSSTHLLPLGIIDVVNAWMPYLLLIGFVLVWNLEPVQRLLETATLHVRWPFLDGQIYTHPPISNAVKLYPARFVFNPLSAAGTACMMAALTAAFTCRLSSGGLLRLLLSVVRKLALPAATILLVMALAFVMNYSGQTAIIGIALAHTGRAFPFFSAVLGWIGVFLTGSDTSSNALFGNLQVVTASRLGLNPVLIAAANSTGGVVGKMISLQTIAVVAAASGITRSEQSQLFRSMLRHSLLFIVLAGLVVLAAAHFFPK
jgi:L-lactate transport